MSGFLDNLAAKSLSLANAVQPRIASLFEPQSAPANLPARLSVHFAAEPAAAREDEPSRHLVLETSHPSSPFGQPAHSISIRSSIRPYEEAAAKQARDGDAAAPHRVEPARARRPSTDTLPVELNAPLDSSRPLAPDASVTRRPAGDPPTPPAINPGLLPEERYERESRTTLAPDIRRIVDEQINRLEARRPPNVTHTEQAPVNRPASPARTNTPAQIARAPGLPAEHSRSPAPVVAPAPEIKITIGRVDVRAVMPAQRVVPPRPAAALAPTSLDDYLKERSGGRR